MARLPGFVRFVVIPAVVAALGFFVVGPYLGRSPKLTKIVQEKAAQFVPGVAQTPNSSQPPAPSDDASKPPPSQISVDVKPLPDDTPVEKPHRRRRRSSN